MQPRRHSVVDITLTSILSVVAALAALGTVGFSFFFVMAADSCDERCAYEALDAAYAVTWVGVAILIGVSGVIVAAVRGWLMWIWPALALLLILVALGIGVHLADT